MNHENEEFMNHKDHKGHKDQNLQNIRPIPASTERIVRDVIGAAIEVHRHLGPGYLEPVYVRAIRVELVLRQLPFEAEKPGPILYRGDFLYTHRLDLVVSDVLVVEVKAVRKLRPIHQAQILSYMKASGIRVGLLLNFNVSRLIDGLRRFVL